MTLTQFNDHEQTFFLNILDYKALRNQDINE